MAEELSVISSNYQMVEGLINNFKSNNWRAGQNTHAHTHTQNDTISKSSKALATILLLNLHQNKTGKLHVHIQRFLFDTDANVSEV